MDPAHFDYPLLKERTIAFRRYQHDILNSVLYKNSLVVVPTSLGKTIVALLMCVNILYKWKSSKILILAPTRPLVHQHLDLFKSSTVVGDQCFALTGKISPEVRKTIWKSSSIRVYFATPELVRNDIKKKLVNKNDFYLVVFDEAHRAVKDYSYTYIAKEFYNNPDHNKIPLVLALSASPSSSREKIEEICSNLFIEQIVAKSEKDDDVSPYVHKVDIEHRRIDLDRVHKEISSIIKAVLEEKIEWLISKSFIRRRKNSEVFRKDLLKLGEDLRAKLESQNNNNTFHSSSNYILFSAIKYQSMSLILLHCRDLVESQGGFALKKFFAKIEDDSSGVNDGYNGSSEAKGSSGGSVIPTKTYEELLLDTRIRKVIHMLENENIPIHPKLRNVISIVKEFLFFGDEKDKSISTSQPASPPSSTSSPRLGSEHAAGCEGCVDIGTNITVGEDIKENIDAKSKQPKQQQHKPQHDQQDGDINDVDAKGNPIDGGYSVDNGDGGDIDSSSSSSSSGDDKWSTSI
ncbi:MAG: DEAD/DEAH box helicase, partial [Thermoproteota archaeon]|nr:DEAD/DEAH box helicase [Thermoproteota archaeon]